jgi:ParB family transcriptional regulator, chromosome partitioning protein
MSRRKFAGSAFSLVTSTKTQSEAGSEELPSNERTDANVTGRGLSGKPRAIEITALDAGLIDASPFTDRLIDDDLDRFEAFVRNIADHGQKVPIQVRPHPEAVGRYQAVYGHRRVAAAKELGIPVNAHIVEVSDRDLAIAQGVENSARQDLSWIERALFAQRMDQAGIRARDMYTALSIDDAELARMRGVCRNIPIDVIQAIGRAPKVGRPRWVALAKSFAKNENAVQNIRDMLRSERIRRMESDARFSWVHELIAESKALGAGTAELRAADGFALGEVKYTSKELRIVASNDRGMAFADFVRAELPRLIDEFTALDNVTSKILSDDSSQK